MLTSYFLREKRLANDYFVEEAPSTVDLETTDVKKKQAGRGGRPRCLEGGMGL